ncbi:MAG: ABC transporter permease [Steroidobacteraceae bacterium]
MNAFAHGVDLEWQALRRERAALSVLVAAVLFYGLAYPLPYAPQLYRDIPVAAVDADRSALSRQLLSWADASEQVRIAGTWPDMRSARSALERNQVVGIVEVPRDFERRVLRGESPAVGIFANAGYLLAYSEVGTTLTQVVLTLSATLQVGQLAQGGKPLGAAMVEQSPLRVELVRLFNPEGGYAGFVVPAVLMVILQQTLLIGIGLLCQARQPDAPRKLGERIARSLGRCVPYLGLYAVHVVFVLGVVFPIYGLPQRGSMLAVCSLLFLFLSASTLLGLVISELFRNRDAVIPVLLFTSLPVVFLSGFSWPAEMLPAPLRWLAAALPSTAGVSGFIRAHQLGASLTELRTPMLHLAALCVIYLAALAWVTKPTAARPAPGRSPLLHQRDYQRT